MEDMNKERKTERHKWGANEQTKKERHEDRTKERMSIYIYMVRATPEIYLRAFSYFWKHKQLEEAVLHMNIMCVSKKFPDVRSLVTSTGSTCTGNSHRRSSGISFRYLGWRPGHAAQPQWWSWLPRLAKLSIESMPTAWRTTGVCFVRTWNLRMDSYGQLLFAYWIIDA